MMYEINAFKEEIRDLKQRAEAAETLLKQTEAIAAQRMQSCATLLARAEAAEARVKKLKGQLKGTMHAGGYEQFTAQVRNAKEQAHNAIYVAQQLEKKVAELEAQNARLRAAISNAIEWMNGRESECGERVENAFGFLYKALNGGEAST